MPAEQLVFCGELAVAFAGCLEPAQEGCIGCSLAGGNGRG